jgi:SPX domain protein involved in polyphosphate accumulation
MPKLSDEDRLTLDAMADAAIRWAQQSEDRFIEADDLEIARAWKRQAVRFEELAKRLLESP